MRTKARQKHRRRQRFSLIEIMIVVVIIGMIMGLVGPNIMKRFEKAKHETARTQVKILSNAMKDYYMDMSEYPGSLEGLITSPGSAKWDGPYLDPPEIPLDPWGEDYEFAASGTDSAPTISYNRADEVKE